MAKNRRAFIKKIMMMLSFLAFGPKLVPGRASTHKSSVNPTCVVYRAVNGIPSENIAKVIELLGGIESVIGPDDIVIIKPNVQWWNHGAPNLQALKTFVDLIMTRSGGFTGEVVIAENCHRGSKPWKSTSWLSEFERNGDIEDVRSFNDLGRKLKQKYGDCLSVVHWIDVDKGAKRVFSPTDGVGYVYCDGNGGVPLLSLDNEIQGKNKRAVIMTYPIFRTDRGTMIDFKNGEWKDGVYTTRQLRFINFAALNHHSTYCGATSAIKNYLGVTDLSGGSDPFDNGRLTGEYFNFHSFPFNKWAPGPSPGMIGAEIGFFMNTIRKADLNITTAEWIGLSSRTDLPAAQTQAVIASEDPVALDYHTTKYLLYPNSKIEFHNPDKDNGPLNHYLKKCADIGDWVFDESKVEIRSWDFKEKRLQDDDELVVMGERYWGSNLKALTKYAIMRWMRVS
jgi:hypothetical protein